MTKSIGQTKLRHKSRNLFRIIPLLGALIVGAIAPAARAADCTTAGLKALSKCPRYSKGTIDVGSSQCPAAYVDQSFTGANAIAGITVSANGVLCVRDSDLNGQPLTVEVGKIMVEGLFEAGRPGAEIGRGDPNNKLVIIFTGAKPSGLQAHSMGSARCPDPAFMKGIEVCANGKLRMYGYEGAPAAGSPRFDATHTSWTFLKLPAGDPAKFSGANGVAAPITAADARTLDVANAVDWHSGDWIVVGGTSYSPFESEFAQLAADPQSDGTGGSLLTLAQPLVYYHFGGADPGPPSPANFKATSATNWGVDERAEIGLISRNIKLTAAITPNDPASLHWGGEIIAYKGFSEVSIQGVELEKFGKDRLGSYPIHFHMDGALGANQTALVNADSIHHSYNKCVTVHETANLTIQNVVCARAVGHLFYEEIGNEQNITFQYNLGLGAMSNSFNIDGWDSNPTQRAAERQQLINNYWWVGDNLASANGYDGFSVPNMDAQNNPTHGGCFEPDPNNPGSIKGVPGPPCGPDKIYFEPASGFWLTNPATILVGNSIGGCQGDGKGYWYVPPGSPLKPVEGGNGEFWSKLQSVNFHNNRVHGCESGIYGENEYGIVSDQLLPTVGGKLSAVSVVSTFDGVTATRNRNRGLWLRPNWFNIKNSRFAMNRDNAALVTAGGFDGASPGDWGLVTGSTFIGISLNNVDRFGPCPYPGAAGPQRGPKDSGSVPNYNTGGQFGCIDQNSAANDIINQGYPPPFWNYAGYYTYDGPARIFNDRFVNFISNRSGAPNNFPINPYLTAADQNFLNWVIASGRLGNHASVYEGDAAIGWFNSNQSSYPVSTTFNQLLFENTDLRHQVFTDLVNFAKFNDGDKNTAIVDHDGSLTGYSVIAPASSTGPAPDDVFPISLNNLPFNQASNSVDECHSEGAQNAKLEGRPTSLISPGNLGSLEVQGQWPYPVNEPAGKAFHFQWLEFGNDSAFAGQNQNEYLYGRNGLGVWEPKVTSGYGYTISVPPTPPAGADPGDTQPKQNTDSKLPLPAAGIPRIVDIGLTDARMQKVPDSNPVQAQPFFVRLGICYGNANNGNGAQLKDSDFNVVRGYRSWGGGLGGSTEVDPELNKYWNREVCHNLDEQLKREGKSYEEICPSAAIAPPNPHTQACDADGVLDSTTGKCKYPKKVLTPVDCSQMAATNPTADKYCYNSTTGWLYLYVAQKTFNAEGPSPVGDCAAVNHVASCANACPAGQYQSPADCSCSTDNPCPNPDGTIDGFKFPETYYSCPNEGCPDYRVEVKPGIEWKPGPSTCADPYDPQIGAVPAAQNPPPQNQLAVGGQPVAQTIAYGVDNIPHAQPVPTPNCAVGTPASGAPPWAPGGNPVTPNLVSFQIANNGPTPASISIAGINVYTATNNNTYIATALAIGSSYTLKATRAGVSCQSNFTTGGTSSAPQYTVDTNNNGCNIVPPQGTWVMTLP